MKKCLLREPSTFKFKTVFFLMLMSLFYHESFGKIGAENGPSLVATIMVTNTNNSGAGSLRQAITEAQSTTAADVIAFNIPGAGVHTITPLTAWPVITRPVFIDGSTQPGYSNTPLIEINATNFPASSSGIFFANNSDSGIKALCINRAKNRGVYMVNCTNMTVEDCIIGMDPTGMIAQGNAGLGIAFTGDGIVVSGSVITSNEGGQFQNVSGANIELKDNIVGLNITGTVAHPTPSAAVHGIEVRNADNVIIENNIVSGNTGHGLLLSGAGTNLEVLNNKIGTDITGSIDLGNNVDGINLSVYTPVNIFDNVVGGNSRYGIISGNNNISFLRNRIGIGPNGADIGNDFDGLYLQDQTTNIFTNSQVGDGTIANANYIAYNGKTQANADGIAIRRLGNIRIPINTNIIHDNAGLGIDLQINGVTSNDAGDGDTGANDFLNFPVINTATLGSLIIDFDLDVPAGDYRMEVYGIPAGQGDPSTHGEGNTYLGTFNINHTGSGVENFVETLAGSIAINAGDEISMTTTLCTDATCTSFEVTSEFSQLAVVDSAPECNLSGVIIKKVGAPTICEILTANPTHPIASLDCDGGGQSNLEECNAGQDPADASDDVVCPTSCQGPCGPSSYYYVAADNHAVSTEQLSGPALTATGYPYSGNMAFGDCMFPQPTPAVMTYTNTGFCLGGISEIHWDGASNSFTDVTNPCGAGFMATQADFNAPVLTEIAFNGGTPIATNAAFPNNGSAINGGEIRIAIADTGLLPACVQFFGYVGAATGESNCQDHVGNYTSYRIPCTGCTLDDGSKLDYFTIKIENSVGDYAIYRFKTL